MGSSPSWHSKSWSIRRWLKISWKLLADPSTCRASRIAETLAASAEALSVSKTAGSRAASSACGRSCGVSWSLIVGAPSSPSFGSSPSACPTKTPATSLSMEIELQFLCRRGGGAKPSATRPLAALACGCCSSSPLEAPNKAGAFSNHGSRSLGSACSDTSFLRQTLRRPSYAAQTRTFVVEAALSKTAFPHAQQSDSGSRRRDSTCSRPPRRAKRAVSGRERSGPDCTTTSLSCPSSHSPNRSEATIPEDPLPRRKESLPLLSEPSSQPPSQPSSGASLAPFGAHFPSPFRRLPRPLLFPFPPFQDHSP
mmetsp:Transcript_62188/g.148288  ORF Transcript_62188/g.148288 Transcript_62188/m.148288 type:complete len:310 (+) Transcript_62188:842-1771(+)